MKKTQKETLNSPNIQNYLRETLITRKMNSFIISERAKSELKGQDTDFRWFAFVV